MAANALAPRIWRNKMFQYALELLADMRSNSPINKNLGGLAMRGIFLMLLALAAVSGCATSPSDGSDATNAAADGAVAEKPEMRCRRIRITGTRVSERVCEFVDE